jgi:outer membrane beta-barrel protein
MKATMTAIRIAAPMILGLCASWGAASASDLNPAEIRGTSQKQQVSVLQQRFFEKSYRPEIGLIGGAFVNEAYTNTATRGARVGLFFSEWLGVEYQYQTTAVTDTPDRIALNQLSYRPLESEGDATAADTIVHPDPEVNPVRKIQDINLVWAPFYGKMNLFDLMIVYADLYVIGGAGSVETDQGVKAAYEFGGGQRFYLAKSMSLRLDVRNRSYTETRGGLESRHNAMSYDFGASYFFN